MFKGLWQKMFGSDSRREQPQPVELTPEQFKALILSVARTHEIELNCSSTFELLDEYAERVARGEDPVMIMPQVRQHLDLCPDCHEEFELLVDVLRSLPDNEILQ